MKLTLKPVETPFAVGDIVWVDQPFGPTHQFPFFQGRITQIILDGTLSNTLVVRHPKETHELAISSAIYGLKSLGEHAGSPRVNVDVQLIPQEPNLFATKQELLDHQDEVD